MATVFSTLVLGTASTFWLLLAFLFFKFYQWYHYPNYLLFYSYHIFLIKLFSETKTCRWSGSIGQMWMFSLWRWQKIFSCRRQQIYYYYYSSSPMLSVPFHAGVSSICCLIKGRTFPRVLVCKKINHLWISLGLILLLEAFYSCNTKEVNLYFFAHLQVLLMLGVNVTFWGRTAQATSVKTTMTAASTRKRVTSDHIEIDHNS